MAVKSVQAQICSIFEHGRTIPHDQLIMNLEISNLYQYIHVFLMNYGFLLIM